MGIERKLANKSLLKAKLDLPQKTIYTIHVPGCCSHCIDKENNEHGGNCRFLALQVWAIDISSINFSL